MNFFENLPKVQYAPWKWFFFVNISEMRETSKIIDFTYPYIKPSKKFQHFEKSIYTPLFYPATYPNGVNGVCVFHCFLRIFHLKIGNQFTPQNTTNVVTTFVVFFSVICYITILKNWKSMYTTKTPQMWSPRLWCFLSEFFLWYVISPCWKLGINVVL